MNVYHSNSYDALKRCKVSEECTMKRDMELCRKILFAIEDQYVDSAIVNISIEGYDMACVAYHCSLLYEAKLVSTYSSQNADNHIYCFVVGKLTWEGHNYIENIREETVWNKTKKTIKEKALPMTIEVIKDVSSAIVSAMVKNAIAGY